MLEQFHFVKLGLAGMSRQPEWQTHWQSLFSTLPGQSSAVAVAYFDHPTCGAPLLSEVIELAKEQPNCSTVLFDTFEKLGDLFSQISNNELADLICESRRHGLTTVVAGSVNQGSLADVLESAPDYIGVRGAVCRGGREGRIDGRLISELLTAMQAPVKI